MKKETLLVNRILRYLNSLPRCKAIKLHGSVHMERGTPDILCIANTYPFLLEVKLPDGKTTSIQDHRVNEWLATGATVVVVRSLKEVKTLFSFVDQAILDRGPK